MLGDMFIYCHIGLSLIVSFSSMRKKKRKKIKKKKRKEKIYINKCARICYEILVSCVYFEILLVVYEMIDPLIGAPS